ncbi:MAG: DUF4412 domain-containing protein, partial [Deltaproteobacteria bacterium]|nr:DUF4412 domain-containing protein [Deltaproteobacteria bacterium]
MKNFKSHLIYTGMFGFSVLLLNFIFSPCIWAIDFSANIKQELLNQKLEGEIHVSGDYYRVTLSPPNAEENTHLIITVDRRKGKTFILSPETNTYQEHDNFTISAYMADPFQTITHLEHTVIKKKIGSETIAGYVCDHYGYYDHDF